MKFSKLSNDDDCGIGSEISSVFFVELRHHCSSCNVRSVCFCTDNSYSETLNENGILTYCDVFQIGGFVAFFLPSQDNFLLFAIINTIIK
jgi:hypothetical protein